MSAEVWLWITIVGIGITGVMTRCSFLLLGERLVLPASIERALRQAPAAVLAATVAPAILTTQSGLLGALENPRLAAALVAVAVMWASRSMLWAMAAGMAAYTVVRLLLAA